MGLLAAILSPDIKQPAELAQDGGGGHAQQGMSQPQGQLQRHQTGAGQHPHQLLDILGKADDPDLLGGLKVGPKA